MLGPKSPPPDCPCQELILVSDESNQSSNSSSNSSSFISDFPTHGAPAPPKPMRQGLVGVLGSKLATLPPIFSPTPSPPTVAGHRDCTAVDATTFQVYLI